MNLRRENPEETLDRAVDAVRDDAPDAELMRAAADRVWEKLTAAARSNPAVAAAAGAAAVVDTIRGCDDYQALLPAYLAGELTPARRLLLEDHSRECVACRRALIAARSGRAAAAPHPAVVPGRRTAFPRRALLAAAAALVFVLVGGWLVWNGALMSGPVATVAAVDGALLAVEPTPAPLAGGALIEAGDAVRTAKGSHAVVRLVDGSEIEMAERTQIRVREKLRGTTVYVDRGSIIVEAADQRPRHLYVATAEAQVSVTGTIFAVQHGVRGSRVSVVEGEVQVRQGRELTVLSPGDQVTTRASLAAVSVEDDIAWSRNFDRYVGLLSELSSLRREIARRVAPSETRFASELVAYAPADSVLYAALPNLSGTLAESYQVFRERLATSPVLARWWQDDVGERAGDLDDAIDRLRALGEHLGPEIVFALTAEPGASHTFLDAPVILAAVARPDSFRAALEAEIARLRAEHGAAGGDGEGIVLVDDPAAIPAGAGGLFVWLGDGLLVATPEAARLAATAADVAAGGSGFTAGKLGGVVADAYADGTQWLAAVDVAGILGDEADDEELAATGFGDVEQLVVERWDEGDRGVTSAEISFVGERRGIASWLAAPAPMGSLDFVSAEAHLAAAFVVKEPAALLDDLAALAGGETGEWAEIERRLGLSLRDDVAAPLGGEVAFALDGPLLPEPSWKVIVEVYDPATLQHTLETAVAEADARSRAEGGSGLTYGAETAGGVTYHRIAYGDGDGVHYLFVDGYLVAAPSRALLERTLAQRAAGSTITAAARFRDLLPRDGHADFSALFFQHVGPLLAPMADVIGRNSGGLSDEQRRSLAALVEDSEPTLAYAYGGPDRIVITGVGPGGPLGIGIEALTGLGGLASMGAALSSAAAEGERAAAGGDV